MTRGPGGRGQGDEGPGPAGSERPARAKKRFGQHFLEPAWVARVIDALEPKPDQTAEARKNNKIELQLPDEKDMERVVSFIERAWRNLIAMADRVQRDVSGKI